MVLRKSVGGVATGLGAYHEGGKGIWVGWPDLPASRLDAAGRTELTTRLESEHACVPVFLTPADMRDYYYGFSNRTLWPLFHHFNERVEYDPRAWSAYERVNRKFAEAVAARYEPGDTIWVQDYQLMLVPRILREMLGPDASIGFFLHIPFPCYEVFRMLPWRTELVEGLLGADLIGFHTYDYARYFTAAARNLLGVDDHLGRLLVDGRRVLVDAFPMGIDFERYAKAPLSPSGQRESNRLRSRTQGRLVMLSVDRLDYTKGIPGRLRAFDTLLTKHPEWRGQVTLVCVAVPSRTRVDEYRRLKEDVDRLVGDINGRFSTLDWTPVRYLYRSLPFSQLTGMYAAADVAVVTPLRDGMNLIAKEYVAARNDESGVLVLSEMAGASRELREAIIVNPNDPDAMVHALDSALRMSAEEQSERMAPMRSRVSRYTVGVWVDDFLGRLAEVKDHQEAAASRRLDPEAERMLHEAYCSAGRRVLLIDYDGTLMPFSPRPADVVPDAQVTELLGTLAANPANEVVVISGRERSTLESWLGDLPISIVAEHGVWSRPRGGQWATIEPMSDEWKPRLRPSLEMIVDRTPGSFVEEKEFSLVWHYRNVDRELAEARVAELLDAVSVIVRDLGLAVMEGNRVIEVKSTEVNKGRAAHRWMSEEGVDFVFAIGDDRTDEDTFAAAPEGAWTVKVGPGPTEARFSVEDVEGARALLGRLARKECS